MSGWSDLTYGLCDACRIQIELFDDADDYDADELGIDPEEDYDA